MVVHNCIFEQCGMCFAYTFSLINHSTCGSENLLIIFNLVHIHFKEHKLLPPVFCPLNGEEAIYFGTHPLCKLFLAYRSSWCRTNFLCLVCSSCSKFIIALKRRDMLAMPRLLLFCISLVYSFSFLSQYLSSPLVWADIVYLTLLWCNPSYSLNVHDSNSKPQGKQKQYDCFFR